MGAHVPPKQSIMPAPPPEKEPYDMLSFPAGLIPKLARRHLQCAITHPRQSHISIGAGLFGGIELDVMQFCDGCCGRVPTPLL
jgi:hypothetical protein